MIIGPDDLLALYRQGLFPMADSRSDQGFHIIEPQERGLLPIAKLHISKSLLKAVRKFPFTITVDTAFDAVIAACAHAREDTWINKDIEVLFRALHMQGFAHSVEAWDGNRLVGGLYGLALGSAFCGESMFSVETDASKIALVHLCARLWRGGFTLLDAQFSNKHLEQFGLYEIPQEQYVAELKDALNKKASFAVNEAEHDLVLSYLENR